MSKKSKNLRTKPCGQTTTPITPAPQAPTQPPLGTTEATPAEQPPLRALFSVEVRPASRCGCAADDGCGGDDDGCDPPSPCEADRKPGRVGCPAGRTLASTTNEDENEVCRCDDEVEVDLDSQRPEQPTRR